MTMHRVRPLAAAALLGLLLSACGGPGTTPETHYYRLAAPQTVAALDTPATARTVVVHTPRARGVYNERPIVYSEDSEGVALKQYYHHYWEESPGNLVQEWMIDYLRARNLAPVVIRRAAVSERITVGSRIERFERLLAQERRVIVALEFRVDVDGRGSPLLLREYVAERAVDRPDMHATALAFSAAMEDVMERFSRDLQRALEALD